MARWGKVCGAGLVELFVCVGGWGRCVQVCVCNREFVKVYVHETMREKVCI